MLKKYWCEGHFSKNECLYKKIDISFSLYNALHITFYFYCIEKKYEAFLYIFDDFSATNYYYNLLTTITKPQFTSLPWRISSLDKKLKKNILAV